LIARSAAGSAAVRYHAGATEDLPRPVHLCRNVMRPRVRS